MAEAIRDGNHVPNMLMESSSTPGLTLNAKGNEVTGRLLVESAAGSGTVTSVSVVTANGFAGSVANATTTPAITLTTTINAPVLAGNGTAIAAATTTGSGSTVVLATSPTLVTPILGTPQSVTLTNGTGLPLSTGVTGQLALANGGTGANLADPGADRIFFWDDSAGVVDWLIVGTGLTITDKTITATGGGVSFGADNQIPYTNATTDDFDYTAGFTFDGTDFAVPGDASIGDDLLLTSSGALININSGNWVATHSSGILTVSTGDLRVTTAGTNAASVVTVGGTQTLTAKTLTAPIIVSGGFIADANGNELIIFTTTASAVNEVTFANAATGNNPKFTASGGDANIGIDFQAKGTGVYRFLGNATQAAELRLYEDTDAGTNYTAFKVGTQAADITYTLPVNDGDSGQFLQTDGSGVLSWAAASGGVNPATTFYLFDDFLGGSTETGEIGNIGWSVGLTGDGNLSFSNDTSGMGILVIASGNGSGNIFINLAGSTTNYDSSFNGPRANMTFAARVNVNGGTATCRHWWGLGQGTFASGRPDRGIWWEMDTTRNANLRGVCRGGSGESFAGTTTAPDSSYHTFSFVTDGTLANVEFFIDGVSKGTVSTNIPSANDNNGPFFKSEYNTSNGKAINVDYFWLQVTGLSR